MRRRRVAAVVLPGLEAYRLPDLMGFLANWFPLGHPDRRPQHDACRWRSWSDYIGDARRLAADLQQKYTRRSNANGPMFSTCAVAYADRHGLESLDAARYTDIRTALPGAPR